MTDPSSTFADYLIAELRCAALRAKLLHNDIVAIGLALKGHFIDADSAIGHLSDCGALRLVALSSDNHTGLDMNNAERTWRGLLPERDGAAASTVEAAMYELRTYGIGQLEKPNTQRRLSELSTRQMHEVIERLEKLRPKYPQITDELISTLREQIK